MIQQALQFKIMPSSSPSTTETTPRRDASESLDEVEWKRDGLKLQGSALHSQEEGKKELEEGKVDLEDHVRVPIKSISELGIEMCARHASKIYTNVKMTKHDLFDCVHILFVLKVFHQIASMIGNTSILFHLSYVYSCTT